MSFYSYQGFRLCGFAILLAVVIAVKPVQADQSSHITFSNKEKALLKLFGPWPPEMKADPGNEYSNLPWAQALGRKLFTEKALSGDQAITCASCHVESIGFADGLKVARGASQHTRNTQGLLNVGYQRWFGWDGGADSLWSASLRPILSSTEMNSSIELVAERLRKSRYFTNYLSMAGIDAAGLSDEKILVVVGKSLSAFQSTLVSDQTPFDLYLRALLADDLKGQSLYSSSAKRGMKIFFGNANCHVCHFGPNFSNGEFHDIGRPFFTETGKVDPGRFAGIKRVQSDRYNLLGEFNSTRLPSDMQMTATTKIGQENFGQWRTPSLRNLVPTAPYMHDGSIKTLREVIDSYAEIDPSRLHSQGEAVLKPQDWSEQDKMDLVAFLSSLSG